MAGEVAQAFGQVDLLILKASGGLEKDRDPSYACASTGTRSSPRSTSCSR